VILPAVTSDCRNKVRDVLNFLYSDGPNYLTQKHEFGVSLNTDRFICLTHSFSKSFHNQLHVLVIFGRFQVIYEVFTATVVVC
jgi:hypothetical protein